MIEGPGKGWSRAAVLTPLSGPASWPVRRIAGVVLVRTAGPAALAAWYPSTLPSWTHEDTSVHAASFTSGVPHHTPPDLAVSAPLLSHTPTPVGSLVKGDVKGWGDDDKGGRQPLVTVLN